MNNSLPSIEKNPSITQTSDVLEICAPLFRNTDINYFHYCRVFDNKSYCSLASDPGWAKHFYYSQYPGAGYEGKAFEAGIYFSQNLRNLGSDRMIQDMQERFSLWNTVTFIEAGISYYDFFLFSMPKVEYDAINFYLSNIDFLKNFNAYFKEKSKKIL